MSAAEDTEIDGCREDGCRGILVVDRSTIHDETVRFECTECDAEVHEDGDRVRTRINNRLGRKRFS